MRHHESSEVMPQQKRLPQRCTQRVSPGLLARGMQALKRLVRELTTGFWSAGTLLVSAVWMLMLAGGPAGAAGVGGLGGGDMGPTEPGMLPEPGCAGARMLGIP
jgi:hypothetical protein